MGHLFKYVTAKTGKKILANRTLRWSSPGLLNDPFDMQFTFQFQCDPDVVVPMAREKSWQLYSVGNNGRDLSTAGELMLVLRESCPSMTREEFDEEFAGVVEEIIEIGKNRTAYFSEEILKQFERDKIFCLSARSDSILMWLHYAQNHTGLILRFRVNTHDNPLRLAKPVRYVDHMPPLLDDEAFSDFCAGYRVLTPESVMGAVVWTKSSHWSYEEEWRVTSGAGRSDAASEDIPFNPLELDGVIFGLRTSARDRAFVRRLVKSKYPHAELLEINTRPGFYDLVVERSESYVR